MPATLTLVGDGEMRPEIEAAIARHDLGAHVTITGWADESRVRAELDRARAMVMASFAEGLPIVVMEALALGRPVLATNVAAMADLVRDGETGWLYTPVRPRRSHRRSANARAPTARRWRPWGAPVGHASPNVMTRCVKPPS